MFKKIFLIASVNIFFVAAAWSADPGILDQQMNAMEASLNTAVVAAPALSGTLWADGYKRPKHEFSFGMEQYGYRYQEWVNGEKFMNTRGKYHGFVGSYTFRPVDMDTVLEKMVDAMRLQIAYASGRVDYTGSGTFSGLKDSMYEVRGLFAKEYDVTRTLLVTPYIGLGWRYLHNAFDAYRPGGYARESRYLYLPLGVEVYRRLSGAWGVGVNLEYDYLLSGWQTSHIEDVYPQAATLVNHQNKGFGFRSSLKVVKELSRVRLSVEPFYRFWKIERSHLDPIYIDGAPTGWGGEEPKNTTQEVGIRMGAEF